MTAWYVAAGLTVGVPLLVLGVALILPCEGCRLRRERMARALETLRKKQES